MEDKTSQDQTMSKKLLILFFVVLIIVLGFIFYKDYQVSDPSIKTAKEKASKVNNEDLDDLKAANKDAVNKANSLSSSLVTPIIESDHYRGELNSPVEVIYYSDFSAPFVSDIFSNIDKLKETFNESIVLSYRHFISGEYENSLYLAQASECASKSDKFWEMATAISRVEDGVPIGEDEIKFIADELNLEETAFSACMTDEEIKQDIIAESEDAEKFGVMGVPTIFVNKYILAGSYPIEDFTDSSDIKRSGLNTIIQEEIDKANNPVQQ